MADLLDRMIAWLDAKSSRMLSLFPVEHNGRYVMEYSDEGGEIFCVCGATREECFEQIEEATK